MVSTDSVLERGEGGEVLVRKSTVGVRYEPTTSALGTQGRRLQEPTRAVRLTNKCFYSQLFFFPTRSGPCRFRITRWVQRVCG